MGRKAFLGGCALSSYRPEVVLQLVTHLKTVYPDLSVIQKCCGKPTKALGQEALFQERKSSLMDDLSSCDIDEVIVACQSCYKTMENPNIKVTSLWALLPQIGLPPAMVGKANGSDAVFSVHDSCSVRPYSEIHEGVRWILDELGYQWNEPDYSRGNTRCCGFGGMVAAVNPSVVDRVIQRRVADFSSDKVLVYCAACGQAMRRGQKKAWHILDLLFDDVVTENSPQPEDSLSKSAVAWKNRYKTKCGIKKCMK